MTWQDGDIQDLLRIELEVRMAEARRAAQIKHLREQGCPWSEIGRVLCITKQAAQQRYGKKAQPEGTSPLDVPLPIGED